MLKEFNKNNSSNHLRTGRKILFVGNGGIFNRSCFDHVLNLAERLECHLVALSVDTRCEGRSFEKAVRESSGALLKLAGLKGIDCELVVRTGDLALAVEDLIMEIKRVELVVANRETIKELRDVNVPVVTVTSASTSEGGKVMPAPTGSSRNRTAVKTAGFGLLSAACYLAVFTNSDLIMGSFTKGGWYAALPIGTVMVFSFVHGAFAHNLWSMLGIEAFNRNRVRKTERKVMQKRKTLRKRPRLYAYVNPFHRIDV